MGKEKQYLEIKRNGITLGAFENVTKFEETENGFKVECSDGEFEFEKLPSGIYVNKPGTKEFPMAFDSYKMCGRRAFRRHSHEEAKGISLDLNEPIGIFEDDIDAFEEELRKEDKEDWD